MDLKKDWSPKIGWLRLKDREDKRELMYELFAWLKEKNLSVQQALDLLSITKDATADAYYAETLKIML